jgi:hypothetical protein
MTLNGFLMWAAGHSQLPCCQPNLLIERAGTAINLVNHPILRHFF